MTYDGIVNYYGSRLYFASVLRLARLANDMTIRELADRTGYNKATIVNIEKGTFGARIDVLQSIASELDINVSFGALSDEVKEELAKVELDIIEVVSQWCKENWRRRPASNEDLLHHYRHMNEQNECTINYLEDELGEIPAFVMLSRIMEYAVNSTIE